MRQHPQWLVVAEFPGGNRPFGISVIHRSRADPDADWTEDAEELAQNARFGSGDDEWPHYTRVAGGDDWRPLTTTLLRDVAAQVDEPLRAGNAFVMATAAQSQDNSALTYAILAHLGETL